MLELDLVVDSGLANKPDCYIASRPIEQVQSMAVVNYNSYLDRVWYRVADVMVPNCQAGQILLCNFSFEVTNELPYAVELSGGLVFTPDQTGYVGVDQMTSVSDPNQKPSSGEMVTTFGGYNVTPQFANGQVWHGMHHGMTFRNSAFVVPEGYSGDCYIAALFYAGGSSYTSSGDTIKVEPMCGDLSVLRF